MLRVGIIGLGVGEQHIKGYELDPRCSVVALCDIDAERLEHVAKRYPGRHLVEDPAEILNNPAIDVVSIASFDDFHCAQVIAAVKAGKHVFVEKPLCLTDPELAQIVSVLRAHPEIKLSSNLILRKNPRFLELKKKISQGSLGGLYYLEGEYNYGRIQKVIDGWRGKIPNYSVVHGGGIHLIDLLCWLCEDRVEEVFAYGNKKFTETTEFLGNDLVVALLKFEKGIVAKVTTNFGCVASHFHGLSVFGEAGTFQQTYTGSSYIFTRDPGVAPVLITDPYVGRPKGDMLPSFVRSILDGTRSDISAQEVVDVMSVSLAIEKSIVTGLPERIDYFLLE